MGFIFEILMLFTIPDFQKARIAVKGYFDDKRSIKPIAENFL